MSNSQQDRFRATLDNDIDINQVPLEWFIGSRRSAAASPKRSPLNPLHEALNAQFVTLEDIEWVGRYGDVYEEYAALKNGAGVLDISVMALFELTGEVAALAMQHFFSNDIVNAGNGIMRYGALVDETGKVADDCIVYKFSNQHLWLISNITAIEDFPACVTEQWRAYGDKLHWRDISAGKIKLQVQGPKAPQVMRQVFPDLELEALPYFEFTADANAQTVIGRCGYSGEDGYEIFVDSAAGAALWPQLRQAGALPYGINAVEYCRVESGLISLNDYIPGMFYPQEIGLGDFVKASSAPHFHIYGQIRDAETTYAQWYLVFEARAATGNLCWDDAPRNGAEVSTRSDVNGTITSLVFSPLFKRFVGLALFPKDAVQENETVYFGDWSATVRTVKAVRAEKQKLRFSIPPHRYDAV